MRIYIDEFGNFLPPVTQPQSFSLVLGLMVPSAIEAELFYEFLRLRDGWPAREIEIKGSWLDERQAADVINLVRRFGCLVEFFAIPMAVHRSDVVDEFKERQAAGVVANLTPAHHENIVRMLHSQAQAIRTMPNQLFLQAFLTILLIKEIVQIATLYFVQRQPEELGDIAWIIDRKDREITQMEKTWTTLLLPFLESHFARTPFQVIIGEDYSHFRRYQIEASDAKTRRHMEWLWTQFEVPQRLRNNRAVDCKRLLCEQREFKDSRDSLGLQLADMLGAIVRRALINHIGPQGWRDFGALLVRKDSGRVVQLGATADRRFPLPTHAVAVCKALDNAGQSMLTPDAYTAET